VTRPPWPESRSRRRRGRLRRRHEREAVEQRIERRLVDLDVQGVETLEPKAHVDRLERDEDLDAGRDHRPTP
jgi:hypothetical protein